MNKQDSQKERDELFTLGYEFAKASPFSNYALILRDAYKTHGDLAELNSFRAGIREAMGINYD